MANPHLVNFYRWLQRGLRVQLRMENDEALFYAHRDRFNDLLQRSILSRIASSMSSSLFDTNGELVPGTLETSDFIIDIIDLGDGVLEITTTDKNTGATSSFQISNGM